MIKNLIDERHSSNIRQGNKEINNIVYPLLIQKQPIEREGIEAIIESTANKYNVKKQYLHSYSSILSDAITKIGAETSFSAKRRIDLINRLTKEIIEEQKQGKPEITSKIDEIDISAKTREDKIKTTLLAIIIAFTSVIAGLLSIMLIVLPSSDYPATTGFDFDLLWIILIMSIFIVASNLLIQLRFKIKLKKEYHVKEKEFIQKKRGG